MSERRIDKIFESLSSTNAFFGELESRVKINSIWKEMVGVFLASRTYVSLDKDETLYVWSKDSTVLSEIRFKAPELLKMLKEKGVNLKKIKVRRS